ncbi:MAG: hypothetical protein JXQ73_00565 [Phycisphaerae bacterium]|nr:hypothetical protein [Phycisphaerae bacterium]
MTCALLLIGSIGALLAWRIRRRAPRWLLVAAVALWAAGASVPVTQWPLRLVFAAYRSKLDHVAELVRTGGKTGQRENVGPFTIRMAEVNRVGAICLWTDLNPAGYTGFMKCSPALVARQNALFWSVTHLDGEWYLVEMD